MCECKRGSGYVRERERERERDGEREKYFWVYALSKFVTANP